MTLKKTPVIFILLLCSTFSFAIPSAKINFIENNLDIAKAQAKQEGKLIMVDFWASWCSPCKWMDEQTFNVPQVANYLNDKYVSVRVNIDNFDGMTYKTEYDVRFLPTILVLDPSGKVIKKYEESMAPSKLLRVLKDLDENKVLPPYVNRNMVQSISKPVVRKQKEVRAAPTYNPSTTGTSKKVLASYTTTPTRNTNNKPTITSANTSVTHYNRPSTPVKKRNIYKASNPGKLANSPNKNYGSPRLDAVSDVGLYQLNVKKAPRNGFSVQVGAYYDYKNVLIEVAKFQKTFAEEVLVHISELNGATCYKVMLGHYNSHFEATNDKKLLNEAGAKDAFVKDLTTL